MDVSALRPAQLQLRRLPQRHRPLPLCGLFRRCLPERGVLYGRLGAGHIALPAGQVSGHLLADAEKFCEYCEYVGCETVLILAVAGPLIL